MERATAPIRKARRKKLLPLQFEQRSMSTQTDDIDITQFLFGGKVAKSLKGSPEKKLRQALQVIESYRVKVTIGIEKYCQLKNELANTVKENKALEKQMAKTEEKYDHKIAKLKDKNYKLKDKLEDKESEVEKLEAKVKKFQEKYEDFESEDDDEEETEEDSGDESSVDLDLFEHKDNCEYLRRFVEETTDTVGETTDTDTYDEKSADEIFRDVTDDIESDDSSTATEELEEVIEDMTEERTVLQSRIEELEKKLKEKDEKLELGNMKDIQPDDDDNLSSTTEESSSTDIDKHNEDDLVSGQESEYSWLARDEPTSGSGSEAETEEQPSDNEGAKRDINNNITGDTTIHAEKAIIELEIQSDVEKNAEPPVDKKLDRSLSAQEPINDLSNNILKPASSPELAAEDKPSGTESKRVEPTKESPEATGEGNVILEKGDVKEDTKMSCYY